MDIRDQGSWCKRNRPRFATNEECHGMLFV